MKKFLLSLLCLISFMAINAETITFSNTDFSGSSSSYVTTETTSTVSDVTFAYNNFNPSSGQIRGNKSNVSQNFYFYNTTPINGTITSIKIKTDNGLSRNFIYVTTGNTKLGTLTDGTKVGDSSIATTTVTYNATDGGSFFEIYFKNGATSGTVKLSSIEIIYESAGGEEPGEGGGEEPGEGGGEEPGDDPVVPETPSLPEGTLYYESFDKCANTGGNDGVWKAISGTPEIQFDNANNTHEKGYGASQCARFGTGKAKGSFTTAALTGLGSVQGGYAIITFKAAAWDGDSNNTIEVSIANGGEFIAETSLTTKKAEWTEYSLGIARGTANTTITISAVKESNNRFFLDEVKVMASTEDKVTGIEDTMVDENAPVEYYNLQGVKVANPENGIFIKKQGGRTSKVVL